MLALEVRGHGLATLALLPVLVLGCLQWLTGMVPEAFNGKGVAAVLDHLNNSVIEGVLVLLQPASQVVGDSGGIVDNAKVSIRVTHFRIRLAEVGFLAQQVIKKFVAEGLISSLGEEGFFLKDGEELHRLLKHVDTFLQIHAEINIGPVKTFLNIFLLFKSEHVLVEELLKLLVDVVNTNLFKSVKFENLKSSNIEHTNVGNLLHAGVNQGFVTLVTNKPEGSLVDGASDATDRVGGSRQVEPLLTHSVPTFSLGLQKYWIIHSASMPSKVATFTAFVSSLISACSSLPTGTKSLVKLPMCIMDAVFLNTSYFISREKPRASKASSANCMSSLSSMEGTVSLPWATNQ